MATKATKIKVKKILASLKNGATITKACEEAKLDRTAFYKWKNKDPKNADEYYSIIDSRTLIVEDALFKTATMGNITAQIFWLKNRADKRWMDKIDHNVSGSVNINFDKEDAKL